MAHKFLNQINSPLVIDKLRDDDRQPKWQKHVSKYGFPETELWSLDYTMMQLLYERLKLWDHWNLMEGEGGAADNIKIGKKIKTWQQWHNKLIKLAEYLLQDEGQQFFGYSKKSHKKIYQFWKIWSHVHGWYWT